MGKYDVDACVVGGGPAGSVAALRLAMLGHRVCLIEKSSFPRPHVGESLTAGIGPVMDMLGLQKLLLRREFRKSGGTLVSWSGPHVDYVQPDQRQFGWLVDRGKFDEYLLESVSVAGVQVFQPSHIREANQDISGWKIEVVGTTEPHTIRSRFLIDATGRKGFLRGRRVRISPRLMALCGYLEGKWIPHTTLVEALHDSWCWGAPISTDRFSAMVFIDPASLKLMRNIGIETVWRSQLSKAQLFKQFASESLVSSVLAHDASAYYSTDSIGSNYVKVGESSYGLDPLSSSGVEKAMHNALIAGIAVHTMILHPDREELCIRFYQDRQAEAVAAHATWSASYYAKAQHYTGHPFWQARGDQTKSVHSDTLTRMAHFTSLNPRTWVRISEHTRIADEPCIVGNEICARKGLSHPKLKRPVVFVGGLEVASLLELAAPRCEVGRLMALWSTRLSTEQIQRLTVWLLDNQILETIPN